jgi:hypothetical protein
MTDKDREAFDAAWTDALTHDEGWSCAGYRIWQAARAESADIIRKLTDIVRAQHEALNLCKNKATKWHPCSREIMSINKALALAAPLVKEEV